MAFATGEDADLSLRLAEHALLPGAVALGTLLNGLLVNSEWCHPPRRSALSQLSNGSSSPASSKISTSPSPMSPA